MSGGVGRSGSPIPRLMTSTPAARFSAILRSSWAKAYGGMRSRRLLGFMQLLFSLFAEGARDHGPGPACQVDLKILPHLHQQLAAVEQDLDRRGPFRTRIFSRVGD